MTGDVTYKMSHTRLQPFPLCATMARFIHFSYLIDFIIIMEPYLATLLIIVCHRTLTKPLNEIL